MSGRVRKRCRLLREGASSENKSGVALAALVRGARFRNYKCTTHSVVLFLPGVNKIWKEYFIACQMRGWDDAARHRPSLTRSFVRSLSGKCYYVVVVRLGRSPARIQQPFSVGTQRAASRTGPMAGWDGWMDGRRTLRPVSRRPDWICARFLCAEGLMNCCPIHRDTRLIFQLFVRQRHQARNETHLLSLKARAERNIVIKSKGRLRNAEDTKRGTEELLI